MDNPYCSYKLTRGPQGAGAHPLSSKSIDVQGFSHKHLLDYMYAHTAIPDESCCVFSISSFGFACAVLRFWRTHGEPGVFRVFHKNTPDKPMLATECCSCLSQRGEDKDFCPDPRPTKCKVLPTSQHQHIPPGCRA